MNPEHWQCMRELFEAAVELPPSDWPAYLQRASADPGVRAEVLEMLQADARGSAESGLLERAPDLLGDYTRQAAQARLGERFGAWRLLRVLGEGGMGTVYLAERVDGGFAQQAALKLVRSGLDQADVVARLQSERQILAGLEHPNIARLLDGGAGARGEPFLAMEYVQGSDLGSYCDARALDIPARLRLILTVCEAVAYAHARLVVHCDLKPANVLVSAAGEVKLLDFGIARLVEPGDSRVATLARLRLYTPDYAAPEQISGALTTTAVDVYALGVILFELLCGQRPYATRGLSLAQIEQQVLQREPGRPSARVSGRGETRGAEESAAGAAAEAQRQRLALLRASTPKQLRRQLRGDLDAIVLKALRKPPQERFASVQLLADDIRAYLQQRPVAARRGSLRYTLGRFVQRHALAVGLAAFASLALVFGLAAALWQADAARREAATAREALAFMQQLFALADPEAARGREVSARELLESGSQRIRTALVDQPDARRVLLQAMAEAHVGLGLYAEALPLLDEAMLAPGAAEDVDGAHRLQLAQAAALQGLGRYRQVLDRLGPLRAAATLDSDRERLRAAGLDYALGRAAQALGQRELALAHHLAALDVRERVLGLGAAETQQVASALVALYQLDRRQEESLALAERSLAALGPASVADVLLRANALSALAMVQTNRGELGTAEVLRREALASFRQIYRDDHPTTTVALNNLASVLFAQRRYGAALSLFEQVLRQRRQLHAPGHPSIAMAANNLANALLATGEPARALTLGQESLEIRRAAFGATHSATALSIIGVGAALLELGRLDQAQEHFEEALQVFAALHGPDNVQSVSSYNNLARIQLARAAVPADCAYSAEAVRRLQADPPGDQPPKLYALALHQSCQVRRGDLSALPRLQALVADYRAQVAADDPYIEVLQALPGLR
jgi:serine/threonine-protein kinase